MRKIAYPLLAAVTGTLALNAVLFGTSIGAPSTDPVSGIVYRDLNNNGIREAGERAVKGVVVASPQRSTVTNDRGEWSLEVGRGERLTVHTGWFRSQCDTPTCGVGPGPDQDFAVKYQRITVKVTDGKRKYDVGLLPDWKGGYPIPATMPIPANRTDVGVRVSFVKPTAGVGAGDSNCYRTDTVAHRACQVGDRPTFLVQIFNEGTRSITDPGGYLQLPPGTRLVSFVPSPLTNHPAFGDASFGPMDEQSRQIPFVVAGTLPPAGAGIYELTLIIEPGAPITKYLQTKGSYPNAVGARITTVKRDAEGQRCRRNSLNCRWGTTNRQGYPDNSDTAGFAIVPRSVAFLTDVSQPAVEGLATATTLPTTPATTTTTTAPATTTTAPATTTTAPATTTTAPATTTTAPATTTTAPATTTTAPATTTTTTAPATTAPPASTGCSVSRLLVPSCGVWLGASTPSRDGSYDYTRGLAEYEAVAQNAPDILHFYKTGGKKFPTAGEVAVAERLGQQRSLLLYNWKPSKTLTWRQIADGGVDADIAVVAAGLKSYPHQLFLNIYHEPEDNVDPAATSGMTPTDYADMYRHVVTELRQHGVTNAVFVWNVMGYYGWRDYLDALYPGQSYVDWVCYDPYVKDDKRDDLGDLINIPHANIGWPGFYNWATAKAPGKPLMMCEWGVDLKTNSDPASFFNGDIEATLAQYPMLKGLVYWNSVGVGNFRIDDPSSKGVALGKAYRQFAARSIFNEMTPDLAP